MKIGVLGFQGAFLEHERHIQQLGHQAVDVRYIEQLDQIDAIILPGGESTTMGKLLDRTGMKEPLIAKIKAGMPAWGTCAGMILLAERIENDSVKHLGLMDITVRRNAYGRQIDSFDTECMIPEVSNEPIPLVFIRAPFVTEVGSGVKVLCEVNGNIVAVRQGHLLGTSFHPELTNNLSFLRYFISMIEK
ncbi:MAG: pyridoxal 5'-phosphate synthase glutaminase subunit PdxT [Odoribacter sp.]|nr:pyridoxal 5'-phosphate synthase glutaminase subunit PdxT [Bacteroidales bacterium]MBR2980726.1 pyridoxal 5'-phosphate synthase glutaminase subunit PdxT [Odoribacter sp.]